MIDFQREERYIVIKRKHLTPVQERELRSYIREQEIPTSECVVVESDWPEYETVWRMIEDRVTGRTPAPAPVGGDVVERVALAIINSDREMAGLLPVRSRVTIPDSDGYVINARAALAAMPPKAEATPDRLARRMGAKFASHDYDAQFCAEAPAAEEAVARWQPIETCEATGQAETVIVAVTCPDREAVVGEAWRAEDGEWWWAGTMPGEYHDDPISEINFGQVTDWMPMPSPPAAIRSGGAA